MLDPHCMTDQQRTIADFGRRMMYMAAVEKNDIFSNAMARVGERLAENASFKGLSDLDLQVVRYCYARKD